MALKSRSSKVSVNTYHGDNSDLNGNVVKTKTRKSAGAMMKKSVTRLNSLRKGVGRGLGRGLGALGHTFLDSPSASSMPLIPFIFVLFFTASIMAVLLFNNDISFSVMLDKLSWVSTDGFNLSWVSDLSNSMKITSDWDIFNFLRDFINLFTSVLAFGIGLVAGLLQLVAFVFSFIKMLM